MRRVRGMASRSSLRITSRRRLIASCLRRTTSCVAATRARASWATSNAPWPPRWRRPPSCWPSSATCPPSRSSTTTCSSIWGRATARSRHSWSRLRRRTAARCRSMAVCLRNGCITSSRVSAPSRTKLAMRLPPRPWSSARVTSHQTRRCRRMPWRRTRQSRSRRSVRRGCNGCPSGARRKSLSPITLPVGSTRHGRAGGAS
mmetsp:Transcript_103302/g.316144  ORF Transcript_103302/g.316144 Transcript_103302/m.316144 type:complete len:202 (+) Transcript_103302:233-838(+)